ncbi:zinc knuckle CX2CX4HX4C containing protein [Tanacetum coccineum]
MKGETSRKSVNFRTLLAPASNGADIVISKESFSTKDKMDAMLENVHWLIRNVPLILKKWTPYSNFIKKDVCNIPVWVKFHDNTIIVFTEDSLSAIATKLGTPLMVDYYTAAMYKDSWGRPNYARVMVELRADVELKDTIVVVVPKHIVNHYSC